MEWNNSDSEWKRRAVPITLAELLKRGLKPYDAFRLIEPLMKDNSEYVQKGLGTLLRGLWKTYPGDVEPFLLRWKDECGRLVIQYATDKMAIGHRKQFRKKNKIIYNFPFHIAMAIPTFICMLGALHPLIQNGKKASLFREKYKIKYISR